MTIPSNLLIKTYGDPTDNPVDPIFTNSDITGDFGDGLLMDIDFFDPDGAGGYAGAYAAGDLIINSAWEHVARRLIPGATRDQLSCTIARNGAANQLRVERTGRGAMHVQISATNDDANTLFALNFPAAIVAYIIANPTHQYRAAIEEQITRVDGWTGNPGNCEAVIYRSDAATGDLLFRMEGRNNGSGGFRPFDGRRLVATMLPDFMSTTGEHFKSISVDGWSNNLPASPNATTARWSWGPTDGGGVHQARSSIARRFVLMDLTVSQAALTAATAAGSPTSESWTPASADARHQVVWAMRRQSTDYYFGDTFNQPIA